MINQPRFYLKDFIKKIIIKLMENKKKKRTKRLRHKNTNKTTKPRKSSNLVPVLL